MSKKVKEVNELVPNTVIELIKSSIAGFKAPLWDDICKFKEISEMLDKAAAYKETQRQELIKELLERFKLESFEGLDQDSKELQEANFEFNKRIAYGNSNLTVDELRVFTKEDFSRIYNPEAFNAADAVAISHWLVKA